MKIKIPKKIKKPKILRKVRLLSAKELFSNTLFTIILCSFVAIASIALDFLIQFIIKLT